MSGCVDLEWRRFGRLIVVARDVVHRTPNGTHIRMWRCACECGRLVLVSGRALRMGKTRSCGSGACKPRRRRWSEAEFLDPSVRLSSLRDTSPDPEQSAVEAAQRRAVRDAILQLPERLQTLLSLVYIDDLTLQDAGFSVGAQNGAERITRERSRQLHNQAIRRIRQFVALVEADPTPPQQSPSPSPPPQKRSRHRRQRLRAVDDIRAAKVLLRKRIGERSEQRAAGSQP